MTTCCSRTSSVTIVWAKPTCYPFNSTVKYWLWHLMNWAWSLHQGPRQCQHPAMTSHSALSSTFWTANSNSGTLCSSTVRPRAPFWTCRKTWCTTCKETVLFCPRDSKYRVGKEWQVTAMMRWIGTEVTMIMVMRGWESQHSLAFKVDMLLCPLTTNGEGIVLNVVCSGVVLLLSVCATKYGIDWSGFDSLLIIRMVAFVIYSTLPVHLYHPKNCGRDSILPNSSYTIIVWQMQFHVCPQSIFLVLP